LNNKVAGRAKLGETERMNDLLCAVLSDELQFINITSANTVSILCSVDLLYYPKYILWIRIMQAKWNVLKIQRLFYVYETHFIEIIQVTDSSKYFPRGPHVGQPCPTI
jgi:hypothetical protein